MDIQNKISTQASYDEVMDYLNSFEDVDGMLLEFLNESKPAIKVISGNTETSYDYDSFLKIFDTQGLEGLG